MPLDNIRPRSDSAVIRNLLDDIERAIDSGASRQEIYESIRQEHGLTISFNGFLQALKRARRKRHSGSHDPESSQPRRRRPIESSPAPGQHDSEPRPERDRSRPVPLKGGGFRPPEGFDPNEFDRDKYGRKNGDE